MAYLGVAELGTAVLGTAVLGTAVLGTAVLHRTLTHSTQPWFFLGKHFLTIKYPNGNRPSSSTDAEQAYQPWFAPCSSIRASQSMAVASPCHDGPA